MHIQFTKLRYKNILSVGNAFIEIDLDKHQTTLISGANGHGKSTLIEAIVFALYGKTFRKINKPQLVNSINKKELMVEIEFTISSSKYVVRRGIKPNVFEIHKDGEMLNKDAAVRDYQQFLEEDILKMSYKSFTQIVILGSATYVPFMELTPAQRREIIEDLLDIQVFSTMNVLLKEKISSNKESIFVVNKDLELLKSKLESAREHNAEIEKLKQQMTDKIRDRIREHLSLIEAEKAAAEKLNEQYVVLSATISDKADQKKTLEKLRGLKYEIESKHSSFLKEIDFYRSNDSCPTCKQGIEHDFKETIITEKQSLNKELDSGLIKLRQRIAAVETRLAEISDVEDELRELQSKENEHRLQIKLSMNTLRSSKEQLEESEVQTKEVDNDKILGYIESIKSHEKDQTDLFAYREILNTITLMLKDGGIKTHIIRQYVPIINKIINQYLSEFELFVDFNLDDQFNETIKSRFRDNFSFASFSEGEKMRISLSILFTWRAVAKLRNSVSTNLLFMDEILDSGCDAAGVESLINILHKLNASDNIWVISHRGQQFAEKFTNHIQFVKHKNFTQLITNT